MFKKNLDQKQTQLLNLETEIKSFDEKCKRKDV